MTSSGSRNLYPAVLPIAEVARRTGVSVEALRIWERRYGFPAPERRPSGHRRYTDDDCRRVDELLRLRRTGMSLPDAVEAIRARAEAPHSVLGMLSSRIPHLEPLSISRRAMLAISRAIEVEATSQATHGLVLGMFQRRAAWRVAAPRWHVVAQRIQPVVALADFDCVEKRDGVWQVPLADHTVRRDEWIVVCDSARWSACLVATQHRVGARGHRAFRALWSVEPEVVREAARLSLATVEGLPASVMDEASAWVRRVPVARPSALGQATRLTNQIVASLP
jgi:MerR family transcriptional regulator, light-induced transcriptional regulator